jgi:hypothetical protein
VPRSIIDVVQEYAQLVLVALRFPLDLQFVASVMPFEFPKVSRSPPCCRACFCTSP